jgi:hypothetical protein
MSARYVRPRLGLPPMQNGSYVSGQAHRRSLQLGVDDFCLGV